MRILKIITLFLFYITLSKTHAQSVRKDTLHGYLDNDDLMDYLVKTFSENEMRFDVYLKTTAGFKKTISRKINADFFSEEDYFKNADIFNDIKGGISILGLCCGTWKTIETHYYQFNDQAKTWIKSKKSEYTYTEDQTIEYEVTFPDKAITISGEVLSTVEMPDAAERRVMYGKLLQELLTKFSNDNKKKQYNTSLKQYPRYIVMDIVKNVPVTAENLEQYNDLGYYMQFTKTEDYNAQYILEEVVRKFPERTVAYINLGDVYWDLRNEEKARKAYSKYIELMKKSGKEAKIPSRVHERVK